MNRKKRKKCNPNGNANPQPNHKARNGANFILVNGRKFGNEMNAILNHFSQETLVGLIVVGFALVCIFGAAIGGIRPLWLWCIGLIVIIDVLIWSGFHAYDRLHNPEIANLLVPADDPDPATLEQIFASEIPAGFASQLPPEIIEQMKQAKPTTIPGYPEIQAALNKPDTLKLFFGSCLGYTSKESQVAIRIKGKDLLTIRLSPDGLSVDAKVFGMDGKILAEIDKNQFFINQNTVFRIERPDPHTLIVYDQSTEKVFSIRFVNRTAISVEGVFRVPNCEPLNVANNQMSLGDRPFMWHCVTGDNDGALINVK